LKKFKAEKLLEVFIKNEKYFEKYESYKEIKELKDMCKLFDVAVEFRPFLARGFSYYNGTVDPTTSASHCVNCLTLPSLIGSSLKTSPI